MITFTAPDGNPVNIDGTRVIRIRASIPEESTPPSQTRIDWVNLQFILESAASVAQQVGPENQHLAKLALPNGAPVWFDAKQAVGPIRIFPDEMHPGTRSGMLLANKKQFVSNTPEEVSAAIAAAGGSPLPIPATTGIMASVSGFVAKMRSAISPQEVWDQ
jgi:hypothetical protein